MDLLSVKDNVQKTAEAIASVIGVDVTVTDDNLVRIAGTGKYRLSIGEKLNERGIFAYCLKNNVSYLVRNPKEDEVCKVCGNEDCSEYAEMAAPISINNKACGVIGLIAFDENQKNLLLKNENNIMDFLDKMAKLIASQIIEKKKSNEIKLLISQLQAVINVIEKSVIITDCSGKIEYYNTKADSLFNIKLLNHKNINEILLDIDVCEMFKSEKEIYNKEFSYEDSISSFRGIINAKLYFKDENSDEIEAAVFIIEELRQIISSARNIISANIVTEFNNIKHVSKKMDNVISLAKKASQTDSTVLITGESGTGKELFARALHYDSSRKKEAFLAINCSAIPENLFESELFGYEEGAYTGALKGGHPGKFELAHKGTLLLDEIGDMPLNLQPKLLRVLQDGKVMRICGKAYIDVDVRIIASTNCNLEEKVKNKEFREDLYYRLNVIPINIPPLRERAEDIELLAKYFINKFSCKLNKKVENISGDALNLIKGYCWSGNVRELENAIEYAVNMTDKTYIDSDSLPHKLKNTKYENIKSDYAIDKTLHTIEELERNEIKKAIKLYGLADVNRICEEIGISRASFYRKIKKYNLISNETLIND